MHGYREEDALGGYDPSMPVEMAKELGLDHLLKIAEAGTHPIIRIIPHYPLRIWSPPQATFRPNPFIPRTT